MRTKIRRALTGTALACAVGASTLAMTPSASALSWHSQVEHSVTTWHCTAQLVAHIAQTGSGSHVTTYYDASETIKSGKYYQASDGPQCDGYFQTSTNGGKTWKWVDDSLYLFGANQSSSTQQWYADNAPTIARACMQEVYEYWTRAGGYQTYESGVRCTAAW